MSQGLVSIEQDPDDKDTMSEIFRNAHSIKGMAASMGLDQIRDLAHAMEDLMEDMRDGNRPVESEAMDLLFQGTDALESMTAQVEQDQELSPKGQELAARIRALRGEDASGEQPDDTSFDAGDEFIEDTGPSEEDTAPSPAREPSPLSPEWRGELDFEFEVPSATGAAAGEGDAAEAGDQRQPESQDVVDERKRLGHAHQEEEFILEEPGDRTPAPTPEPEEPGPPPPPQAPDEKEPSQETAPEAGPATPEPPAPAAPEEPPPGEKEVAAEPNCTVRVVFSPRTASPAVRGLILFKRLSELGDITGSRPSSEEVKAGRFMADEQGMAVEVDLFTESDKEEVEKVMGSMTDVHSFDIKSPEAKAPLEEAPAAEVEPSAEQPEVVIQDQGRLEYDPFSQVQALPQTVRVRTTALDRFINTLGEMILTKNELREVAKTNPIPALERGLARLETLAKDFNDQVMSVRMMPLESVAQRLPRVVRDLAKDEGKKVRFEIKGQDIELDRAILEQLNDPLIHLLRNAVNHGIEPAEQRRALGKPEEAAIVLEAFRMRDLVLIEVRDDGQGMDPFTLKETSVSKGLISWEQAGAMSDEDAYQLIFQPGFSTSKQVGMISGRGVGMDAVKHTVENIGGYVTLSTQVGKGSTFTLHLPRTIAIVNVLLVALGEELFAVPISKILKTVEIMPHQVRRTQGAMFFLDRQEMVPMKALHRFLDLPEPELKPRQPVQALVVESQNRRTALMVDELVGQEEAFIRPLGKPLQRISGLSGVTMLGDGRVVFVLDTMGML